MALCAQAYPISRFTAGDTVRFTVSESAYPATGYTMAFILRNGVNLLSVSGTPNGASFDVVLTAEETAALQPGQYSAAARFTNTSTNDVSTVNYSTIKVYPDLSNDTVGPRRAAYNAALAAMEGLASKKYATSSINGQTYTLQNMDQLTKLVDRMKVEAIEEDRLLGIGTAGGRVSIITRM